MVNEDQVRTILVAIAGLTTRLDAMETARSLARFEQEEWKKEVRDELHEIKEQTTETNGNVRELQLWRARLNGAAAVFSWWKTAVATVAAALAVYLISHAA